MRISFLRIEMKSKIYWSPTDKDNTLNYPNTEFDNTIKGVNPAISQLRIFSRNAFNTLHETHEYIGNIEVMNKNIVVVMRGHRDKRGDVKKDQLIKDAVTGTSSSGFLVSKRTGQPAIDGTAPISYQGEIVGGIKVGMYLTESVIIDIEEKTGTKLLIFDGNTAVMTSKFNNEESYMIGMDDRHTLDLFYHSAENETQSTYIKDTVYEEFIQNNEVYTQLYTNGEKDNYSSMIVPINDYTGRVIGAYSVFMNNENMLYEIESEVRSSSIRVTMILLLSALVSYVFSYQIGDPIMRFTNQIVSMRQSDGLKRVTYSKGPVELSEMAFEFNVLVDNINFQKQKNEELKLINNLDGLTNLQNHKKFYEDIEFLQAAGYRFSLIFFDLDHFKSINDNLGHSVGDVILREVSNILKMYEEKDSISAFRYGGEEFAMLCIGVCADEAMVLSEKVRSSIYNSEILKHLSKDLKVTISAGVSTCPDDSSDMSNIIKYADYAMYYSKSNGRNKTTQFNREIEEFFIANSERTVQKNSLLDAVNILTMAMDAKDGYTGEHSKMVMMYSMRLATKLGYKEQFLHQLKFAALLHDCGKIGVCDSVLFKKGQLTPQECVSVKKHPVIGYNIVKNLSTDEEINLGILHHHENWDGSGYPHQLEGDQIPLISRMIFIVDSYLAMLSDRPYRKAMSKGQVIKNMLEDKAIKFDPTLLEQFIGMIDVENVSGLSTNLDIEETLPDILDEDSLTVIDTLYDHEVLNIVLLDRDHRIVYANDPTLMLIDQEGYKKSYCFEAIIGSTSPCKSCRLEDVFKSKSIQQSSKHEVLINGKNQDILQVWVPIMDSEFEVQYALEVAIKLKPME